MHSIIPIVFETIVCLSILYSARLPSDVKRLGFRPTVTWKVQLLNFKQII